MKPGDYDAATEQFQLIGKYVLREKIGEGGMGDVWLGHHPDFNIPIAIKTIRGKTDDREYAERFVLEARTAALLNHPRIARIFDAGTEEGVQYLVMEYLPGGTVRDVLAGGALDPATAVYVAKAVAEGLAAAREQGIIHRDVKPDNIMMDAKGEPKLVDLGLAKVVESSSQLTTEGTMMGTPAYIAPEQAKNASKADHRADIYSLGATLFHMLTGKPPYEAETAMATALRHCLDPVPNPSTINAELPARLSAVVQKMMAKEPAERYQTAEEVIEALEAATRRGVADKPPAKKMLRRSVPKAGRKRQAATPAVAAKAKRTNRLAWVVVGLLAALVLTLAAVALSRSHHRPGQQGPIASLPGESRSGAGESSEPTPPVISRATRGLVGFYDFAEEATALLQDAADRKKGVSLVLSGDVKHENGMLNFGKTGIARGNKRPHRLLRQVRDSNELSIEAWIQPDNLKQEGPARIVTYSDGTANRNFTLGQEGDRLDVRLRTNKRSSNGQPSLKAPNKSLAMNELTHVIFTRDDTGRAVLYQNGKAVMEEVIPGDFSTWDEGFELAIGNEVTNDRPWRGQVHLVALYARALRASEVLRNFKAGPDATQ